MAHIRIGITQGDINGVGYELILKTFQNEDMLSLCTPVVYGSTKAATYHRKALNSQTSFQTIVSAENIREHALNLVNCFGEEEQKIEFGTSSDEAGKAALVSLDRALEDLQNGQIDVLVTSPVNKANIKLENGESFPGQTAYIESKLGEGRKAVKMYISGNLRVALLTSSLPVSEIAGSIVKEAVAEKIVGIHNTLKRDFNIDIPRIAVLSLNPRGEEENQFGKEEKDVIIPVIEELFKRGVRCMGPYPADEFFGTENYKNYDAVLAMYHDQGVAPFRAISLNEGINYTAGLPIIRTAPAMGVSYNIAGKNVADEQAFRDAIYTAIDVARNRNRFDNSRRNPLKKQYFEKRDDSDKLKLDQETED